LALAAAVASFAGALGDHHAMKVLGGRTMEATFGLILVAVAGLLYALTTVRLEYSYVAAMSGFQEPIVWRIAGLWSGPAGGLLLLTLLSAASGALSFRTAFSRHAAARTGALAALTLIGLLTVVARARPFAQPASPAAVGAGLPMAVRDVAWQVEALAMYLAVACGGFVFAGVVAGPLIGRQSERRAERTAMVAGATSLTVAIFAAAWRAYEQSGALFEVRGFTYALAYAPAWLLAYASLHAPGGLAVPTWALRWRRMLEFAFLPTVLGVWASVLSGLGGSPPPRLWAGGLAVGVIAGAMAGAGYRETGADSLRHIPGYGSWAFRGAFLALAFAGIAAAAGLSGASFWPDVAWALVLFGLATAAAWSVARPAGSWRRVGIWSGIPAAVTLVGLYTVLGRRGIVFAVAAGLVVAMAVGSAAEAVRLSRARRRCSGGPAGGSAMVIRAHRRRTGRRRASSLAHIALALIGLGIAAEGLTRADSRVLHPGDVAAVAGWPGRENRATYLGLSRYRVGEIEKRVATFKLERGGSRSELATAEILDDLATGVSIRRPALRRGILYDTIVSIDGLRPGDGVSSRLAVRPLPILVWLGGVLLLVSTFGRWSRVR
jgi:cytochrome c biogenesis factor